MTRTDDGEFELILGNRQLLSVFFLVVILLGVFFTLGYVVGRGTGSGGQVETASAAHSTGGVPAASDASPGTSRPSPVAPPAVDSPRPEDTPLAKSPEKIAEHPAPGAAVAASPSPAAAERSGEPALIEPQSGQVFIQIGATTRAEAFLVAGSVGKKGFPVVVAQTPDKSKYRILVGPLSPKDTALISKTKGDMEALGFNKPFIHKYK